MESLKLLASFLKLALRTELEQQGHVSTERLSQSIDVLVGETITGFEITGQAVYYAKYVNTGRKAGGLGVPIESLIEWIRRRKIHIEGMNERSIAFMFQHSIRKKGIPASLFIDKTLKENSAAIDKRVTDAMGSMVDTFIDNMFNDLKTV